jgi:phytoene desaturase
VQPSSDHYDAVVIGAGLGGLSAAACLAKAGRSVLVVERQDGPGGNAHAFRRGPYTFDPAVHVTAHGYHMEFLGVYLDALQMRDKLDLVHLDELFTIDVAGTRFTLPTGVNAVVQYLSELFPAEADGIRSYVDTCGKTTIESQLPPSRVALKDLEATMAAYPLLFKYRSSTLATVIGEFVQDTQLQALLGAHWPYLGLPPSTLSFMAGVGSWMALMDPGPVYVRGGFQRLADALVEVAEENGGELIYERAVTSITLDAGAATGVVLEGGDEIRAPLVISNGDARRTFETLVGYEHLPEAYVRRLERMRPSVSAFMLYAASTLPIHEAGLASEAFVYDSWDHDATWADVEAGRPGGMWLSVPTLHDQSVAPPGEHLVLLTSLMPYDIGRPWSEAKSDYEELMVERAEALLPGFRDSLTFVESASPETFERHTLAQKGAIYGWANSPNQTLPKRLGSETPVGGLHLVGHWTEPGSGSLRCMFSGLRVAAAVEGEDDPVAFLGRFF